MALLYRVSDGARSRKRDIREGSHLQCQRANPRDASFRYVYVCERYPGTLAGDDLTTCMFGVTSPRVKVK